jgi:hypothetical protein
MRHFSWLSIVFNCSAHEKRDVWNRPNICDLNYYCMHVTVNNFWKTLLGRNLLNIYLSIYLSIYITNMPLSVLYYNFRGFLYASFLWCNFLASLLFGGPFNYQSLTIASYSSCNIEVIGDLEKLCICQLALSGMSTLFQQNYM